MGGSGVIDQFLNIFTTYIDLGFGLLGGDVRLLSQTLIAPYGAQEFTNTLDC